jgi:hypothetical protein
MFYGPRKLFEIEKLKFNEFSVLDLFQHRAQCPAKRIQMDQMKALHYYLKLPGAANDQFIFTHCLPGRT